MIFIYLFKLKWSRNILLEVKSSLSFEGTLKKLENNITEKFSKLTNGIISINDEFLKKKDTIIKSL